VTDQTKEKLLVVDADNLKKSVERAGFNDLKEKAITEDIEGVKIGIGLDEEFYVTREIIRKRKEETKRKNEKRKKILRRALIVLMTIGLALIIIDEGSLYILPAWVMSSYGYILVAFVVITMLIIRDT